MKNFLSIFILILLLGIMVLYIIFRGMMAENTADFVPTEPAATSSEAAVETTTSSSGDTLVPTEEPSPADVARAEANAESMASLAAGEVVRCTFTSEQFGQLSEGILYSDGERIRVDSSLTTDGTIYQSGVIELPAETYVWNESAEGTMAFVVPSDAPESPMAMNSDTEERFGIDPAMFLEAQDATYTCDPWVVDESVFVAPSTIDFTTQADMMQSMDDTARALEAE